jgi:2TM domain
MDDNLDPRYKQARRHVKNLRGFYSHATTYICVVGGMLVLNLVSSPGHFWVQWVALGWGIGLLAHGLSVIAFGGAFGKDWEERKIREYLDRDA